MTSFSSFLILLLLIRPILHLLPKRLKKTLSCLNLTCQLAHLAPTYAAVMALATIGTHEALDAIDRYLHPFLPLYTFIHQGPLCTSF
jgi:hypothetical protein